MAGDALLQQLAIASDIVLTRQSAIIHRSIEIPILENFQLTTLFQPQRMAGRQFANSRIHAFRLADVSERQILCQRFPIELRLDSRIGEDGFYLRSEQKGMAVIVIVDRLDFQPVSRNFESPSGAVPDSEGKHAAQVLDAVLAILFV